MDNDTFVAEESPREPPVYNDNQQGNNFTQTQSNLKPVHRVAKKGPMNPTPLYISFCFSPSLITYFLILSGNIRAVQDIQLKLVWVHMCSSYF